MLDIGSNTGHLLVVDAHGGAAPLPAYSYKEPLRLAEHLDEQGAVNAAGVSALTQFVAESLVVAEDKGCEEMLGFATSAVRDAVNSDDVLEHVRRETDVTIEVLSGEDEARLTFLAVRRWFGWSAGRLAVFDIGGGSLEIAHGADESDLVHSGLEDTMMNAYHGLREIRNQHDGKADLRTAAFIDAIDKIAVCYQDLGIFP